MLPIQIKKKIDAFAIFSEILTLTPGVVMTTLGMVAVYARR